MNRLGRVRRGVFLVVATAAGCTSGRGEGAPPGGERWSVGAPSLALSAGPGTDFLQIAGAMRLSDGRLVVADGGSSEVRYFAPDGALLGTTGGRGEGPGEFALIQSMGPAGGDSVWVYDYGTTRITLLDARGRTARTAQVTPPLPAGAMVGRAPDGTFVLAQMWSSGDAGAPVAEGRVRNMAAVVRYTAAGALADTLALVPGREVYQRMEGERMTMGALPFARAASLALLGEDVVLGDQFARGLDIVGPRGLSAMPLVWDGPDLALTDGEVDAWIEEQVAAAPAPERAGVRAYLAEAPMPERRPAYGRLLPAADGRLWVAAYAHPSRDARRWDILDPVAGWVGAAEMPERFRPFQIGDRWILGVARDELDVERIELRPIERAGS
jgi:hypothetical protein